MRILAIGAGAGIQDILLLDTTTTLESSVKMVMPSPTEVAARRIRRATQERRPVLLTGVTMGSGACLEALQAHVAAGFQAFATERAATTFDPDLAVVRAMGVVVLSEDEAQILRGAERIQMQDLDLVAIRSALASFEVPAQFDGLAVGCLDHGAPPPGVSERAFRFDHMRRVASESGDLNAFAMTPPEVPDYLPRARSMLACRDIDVPTVYLDTGVASVLGALQDPRVSERDEQCVIHLGNLHALAFHTAGTNVLGMFEHHTDLLSGPEIDSLAERFLQRDLTHEEVFSHHGHGLHYLEDQPSDGAFIVLTGPQRAKLRGSRLHPYVATPMGDTMISGCLGLVKGWAARNPSAREEIEQALAR